MSRYVEGLSSDLFVQSPDFESGRAALAMDLLSFCKECGGVVYRRDLHDAWHSRVTPLNPNDTTTIIDGAPYQ